MTRGWKTATAALWAALLLAAAFWTVSDGFAGQDRKPILVGGSLSLTGRYAAMGKMQEMGYRLWEKETNAAGGLLGRPVTLRILDDGSDPERSGGSTRIYLKTVGRTCRSAPTPRS